MIGRFQIGEWQIINFNKMKTAGTPIHFKHNGDLIAIGQDYELEEDEWLSNAIGSTITLSGTVDAELSDYEYLVLYAFIQCFIYRN